MCMRAQVGPMIQPTKSTIQRAPFAFYFPLVTKETSSGAPNTINRSTSCSQNKTPHSCAHWRGGEAENKRGGVAETEGEQEGRRGGEGRRRQKSGGKPERRTEGEKQRSEGGETERRRDGRERPMGTVERHGRRPRSLFFLF